MAIAKFGAIITTGAGKLGGHVFQRKGQHVVVRTNSSSTGKHYNSDLQTQRLFNIARQRYQALASATQTEWNALGVKFPVPDWDGDNRYLSGFQFHNKATISLLRIGVATPITPSAYVNQIPSLLADGVLVNIGSGLLSVRLGLAAASGGVQVYAGLLLNSGQDISKLPYKFIGIYEPDVPTLQLLYDNLESIFGTINFAQAFGFKLFRVTSSGVVSVVGYVEGTLL